MKITCAGCHTVFDIGEASPGVKVMCPNPDCGMMLVIPNTVDKGTPSAPTNLAPFAMKNEPLGKRPSAGVKVAPKRMNKNQAKSWHRVLVGTAVLLAVVALGLLASEVIDDRIQAGVSQVPDIKVAELERPAPAQSSEPQQVQPQQDEFATPVQPETPSGDKVAQADPSYVEPVQPYQPSPAPETIKPFEPKDNTASANPPTGAQESNGNQKNNKGILLPGDNPKKKKDDNNKSKKTPEQPKRTGGGRLGGNEQFLIPEFMGVKIKAKRVCIIADRSKSMYAGRLYWDYRRNIPIKGDGTSWEYLQEELLNTLKALEGKAEFYIIFFDTDTVKQPIDHYARSKADVAKVVKWVKSLNPQGKTEPLKSFEIALTQLDPPPDEIIFMTDGIVNVNVYPKIMAMNNGKKKVKISTIQLDLPGTDDASLLMSQNVGKNLSATEDQSIKAAIDIHKDEYRQNMPQLQAQHNQQVANMRHLAKLTDGQFSQITPQNKYQRRQRQAKKKKK